jgi:hypothetical protein
MKKLLLKIINYMNVDTQPKTGDAKVRSRMKIKVFFKKLMRRLGQNTQWQQQDGHIYLGKPQR